jgi:hypothetical protein
MDLSAIITNRFNASAAANLSRKKNNFYLSAVAGSV